MIEVNEEVAVSIFLNFTLRLSFFYLLTYNTAFSSLCLSVSVSLSLPRPSHLSFLFLFFFSLNKIYSFIVLYFPISLFLHSVSLLQQNQLKMSPPRPFRTTEWSTLQKHSTITQVTITASYFSCCYHFLKI